MRLPPWPTTLKTTSLPLLLLNVASSILPPTASQRAPLLTFVDTLCPCGRSADRLDVSLSHRWPSASAVCWASWVWRRWRRQSPVSAPSVCMRASSAQRWPSRWDCLCRSLQPSVKREADLINTGRRLKTATTYSHPYSKLNPNISLMLTLFIITTVLQC